LSTKRTSRTSGLARLLRKSLVSGFVLGSYAAYALHEHYAAPAQDVAALQPTPQPGQGAPSQDQVTPAQPQAQAVPAQKLVAPTATPAVTSGSQYKNGTFTGVSANAFYGQVQVQVMIENGKISSVTFLNYPKDRRTSARINSYAIPYLQSEAIQAQNANVDVISGATLTSEAFAVSLQSALRQAQG
jgi:uncharacterized protein with FMN-binding domain